MLRYRVINLLLLQCALLVKMYNYSNICSTGPVCTFQQHLVIRKHIATNNDLIPFCIILTGQDETVNRRADQCSGFLSSCGVQRPASGPTLSMSTNAYYLQVIIQLLTC